MKKKLKFSILFVLTFFIGGLAGFILYGVLFVNSTLSFFYGGALTETAIDAYQLQQGKTSDVLERKDSAIPSLTLSYYQFYKHSSKETRNQPLWQVQRYYETTQKEIPDNIKHIFKTLPPRPLTSCELKRINDANANE